MSQKSEGDTPALAYAKAALQKVELRITYTNIELERLTQQLRRLETERAALRCEVAAREPFPKD